MASSSGTEMMSLKDQSQNRSSNVSQHSTTPYQPPHPMAQPKSHSIMFEKVSEARRLSGYQLDDFYTDEDVKDHSPTGWPSISATQMFCKDHDSFRSFRPLTNLVLKYYEQKIWAIENKLDEMNFKDAEAEGRPLRSFPFNREEFLSRCVQGAGHLPTQPSKPVENTLGRETEKNNLIVASSVLLREYYSLLHSQHEIKKLPQVSRSAHEQHFKEARGFQGLDDEACAFMRYMDDFITTEPDYMFRTFESLLYKSPPWVVNFLKRFCCLFGGADDSLLTYSLQPFEVFFKTLLVLALLALLITPVSILYIAVGWTRAQYLAVVIVSSTLFAGAMALFEPRTAHLLVGITAFFAVLVTFLSNINSCGTA
ncbi:hypothetical protein GGS26DRAFT_586140 [Hypomontagnella submonticulosa]|nr:hypothetical protein GGS26DRAFT_586140 [Hypomontagnella submonticulosa]